MNATKRPERVREMFVSPGEYAKTETSVKVWARWIEGDVAEESEFVVRVRVKVVDDHVLVMVERTDDNAPEVLVRL